MRKALEQVLVVLCVGAATLAAAAPAGATAVEITDSWQEHCPSLSFSGDTVSGGCALHMVGANNNFYNEIEFGFWFFGSPTPFHYCDMEMTLRMDEDGNAAISDVVISDCSGSPTVVQPCGNGNAHGAAPNNGEIPWRSAGPAEETDTDELSLPIAICLTMSTFPALDCEGVVTFTIDTGTSPFGLSTDHTGVPGTRCFMEGTWLHEMLEIDHLEV